MTIKCFKNILFILALLLPVQRGQTQDHSIHVLFIGNSLTQVNNLPGMIADLAKQQGIDMSVDMYTPGGYTFEAHAKDAHVLAKINQENWDFVVLQEQSQRPALPEAHVRQFVFPYAEQICQQVRQANPKAQIIFYMTMAKKDAAYTEKQTKINTSYALLAQENKALLAPVGKAWQSFRQQHPSVNIYADDTHPNPAGTYLTACVFFKTFFNQSVIGLTHPGKINNQTAQLIQHLVEKNYVFWVFKGHST